MNQTEQTPEHFDDLDVELQRLAALADLMDARFQIPGIPIRFGLDGLIGLIPGIGDTINLSIAGYIVFQGYRLGARRRDLILMLANIIFDWFMGLIPLIGDIFDVTWKGNLRNIRILENALRRNAGKLIDVTNPPRD